MSKRQVAAAGDRAAYETTDLPTRAASATATERGPRIGTPRARNRSLHTRAAARSNRSFAFHREAAGRKRLRSSSAVMPLSSSIPASVPRLMMSPRCIVRRPVSGCDVLSGRRREADRDGGRNVRRRKSFAALGHHLGVQLNDPAPRRHVRGLRHAWNGAADQGGEIEVVHFSNVRERGQFVLASSTSTLTWWSA